MIDLSPAFAKQLYLIGVGEDEEVYFSREEWEDIRAEIHDVLSAKSDRAAVEVIRWWGCWTREYPAVAFVRRVRQAYRETLVKPVARAEKLRNPWGFR